MNLSFPPPTGGIYTGLPLWSGKGFLLLFRGFPHYLSQFHSFLSGGVIVTTFVPQQSVSPALHRFCLFPCQATFPRDFPGRLSLPFLSFCRGSASYVVRITVSFFDFSPTTPSPILFNPIFFFFSPLAALFPFFYIPFLDGADSPPVAVYSGWSSAPRTIPFPTPSKLEVGSRSCLKFPPLGDFFFPYTLPHSPPPQTTKRFNPFYFVCTVLTSPARK